MLFILTMKELYKPFSYLLAASKKDQSLPRYTHLNDTRTIIYQTIAKGKMPDCISNSWKDIWDSKIERAYKYDFEVYDERSKDWNNATVDIFVSTISRNPDSHRDAT